MMMQREAADLETQEDDRSYPSWKIAWNEMLRICARRFLVQRFLVRPTTDCRSLLRHLSHGMLQAPPVDEKGPKGHKSDPTRHKQPCIRLAISPLASTQDSSPSRDIFAFTPWGYATNGLIYSRRLTATGASLIHVSRDGYNRVAGLT